jgi:MFS transporter, DHA1 family, multidrug resistance protein
MMILVLAAVAFYWMSLYFYVPTLPVYAEEVTPDLATVGVILSMYGLWQALVRLPLGIAADWLGRRKPFLIFGFALAGLGAWVMGTATNADGLIVGRAITGLAAATWVPLVVLFSSLFPPHEAVRAAALLSLVNSISRMLATGVTGTLNEWSGGYQFAFFLAMGVAGLAILVTLPVREIPRPPKRPSVRGIGVLITRPDVLIPALLSSVGQYIAWATTFGFLPILARELGATGEVQSILVSLNIGIAMIGNLLVGSFSRRFSNVRLVYISFALMAAGVVMAALAESLLALFAAQALIGLGAGVGYPLFMGMSIEKVTDQERATAMGLHQAVYAIGMFAGPWLSGIIADAIGVQPMFAATAAATTLLAIAMTQLLVRGSRTSSQ